MIVNQVIYAVIHLRCSQTGQDIRREELITERWFDSLADAEHFFRELRRGHFNLSSGTHPTIRIWESKRLYQLGLGDEAKALSAGDPDYHAQRLALHLDLQPSAGTLLDEEPKN